MVNTPVPVRDSAEGTTNPMPPWYEQLVQQMGGNPVPNNPVPMMIGAKNLGMWNQAMGAVPGAASSVSSRLAGANSLLQRLPLPPGPDVYGPTAAPRNLTATLARATAGRPGYLSARALGGSTEGLGLRSLARGSLGRAGLYGLGGSLAGGAINSAFGDPNASWDNALAGAAQWGGMGAGLGSLVAPGVGTAIGGALGAGVGALRGLSQAKNEGDKAVADQLRKELGTINDTIDKLGGGDELRQQALYQLQLGVATGNITNRSGVKTIAAQVRSTLPDALLADQQQQQQQRSQEAAQAAVQAWMGPMLQDQLNKSQYYADQFGNAQATAAGYIEDPALRAAQLSQAKQISATQAATNAAYAQQIAAAPGYWGAQQDVLEQIRQAQQQMSQSTGGMDILQQIYANMS